MILEVFSNYNDCMISLHGNPSSEMPVSPVLGTFKLRRTSELAFLHLKLE